MKRKLFILPLILILFLVLAPPALAQGPDGRVVFGGNLTLEAGEEINGDVVVFGGNVTLRPESRISGDMVVFGGNATIDGTINGDVAMLGGNVKLGDTAVVEGDIGLVGGNASVAEGARIEGNVERIGGSYNGQEGFDVPIPPIPPKPAIPDTPAIPDFPGQPEFGSPNWPNRVINFFEEVFGNIALIIVLATVGWLVASFMPQQMKTVGDTLVDAPVMSFGVGFLTTLVLVLLALTICLLCIAAPGLLILFIAGLFGWIVLGQLIGERVLVASGNPAPNFTLATIVGVTILTIVARMPILSSIPCIGFIFWLIGFLVTLVAAPLGVGAVILTRFGTRPYYATTYGTSGGPSPTPRPRPGAWREDDLPADEDFSDLDVNSASEAELKAKIRAALDEADTAPEKPKKKKPAPKTDEEPPTPAAPDSDSPDSEEG